VDPADSSSVRNSSIVITAILSRMLLGEKMSIVHVTSIVTTLTGIFLIAQPSFIFSHQSDFDNAKNGSVSTNNQSFSSTTKITLYQSSHLSTTIGLLLASTNAFAIAVVTIIVKKLADEKVHFSINMLITSMLGLPVSSLLSLVLNLTKQSNLVQNIQNNSMETLIQVCYSVVSALIGISGQVLLNLSMRYEDASKVSIIKASEIFFVFLMQYVLLSISLSVLKLVGGVLIFLSGAAILVMKIMDRKHFNKMKTRNERQVQLAIKNKPLNLCARILFFKF
jgi:drug/metabolite transporter (DMT)-like permease